jgi:hypothetical protein
VTCLAGESVCHRLAVEVLRRVQSICVSGPSTEAIRRNRAACSEKAGEDSTRSHRCRMRSTDVAPVSCRSNRGSFPGTGTRDIPERKQTQAQRRQVRPMRLPQVLHNQIKDWQIRLTLSARKGVRHMLPHLDRHSIDGAVARRSFTKSHFDCSRTCRCRRRTMRARGIHLGPGR